MPNVVRPHHCQIRLDFLRKPGQSLKIFGSDRNGSDRRAVARQPLPGDARVARGAPHPFHAPILRQLPNDRVLPSAASDNQNLHCLGSLFLSFLAARAYRGRGFLQKQNPPERRRGRPGK